MSVEFWVIIGILGYFLCAWVCILGFIAIDGPGGNDDPMLYGMSLLWPVWLIVGAVYGFCKSAFYLGRRIHENRYPESIMVKDDD